MGHFGRKGRVLLSGSVVLASLKAAVVNTFLSTFRSVSEQLSPVIPLIFFSVLEIFMLVVFRDNMLLMFIQLFSPVIK